MDKKHTEDPLIFLESVMLGQDPRALSDLYMLVNDINDLTDGSPSESDWAEVLDTVQKYYKYQPVALNQSLAAGKTLAEYKHPRKKQIEHVDDNNQIAKLSVELSDEEIERFKKVFNEQF